MSKLAWIAGIAWFAAACGRQPPPPSGTGAPSGAPPAPPPAAAPPPTAPAVPPPASDELCDPRECGPPMRMPNRQCADGSMGGPTDRCLRRPDGRCAWEVRPCPPPDHRP